jgi:hypothetical protein
MASAAAKAAIMHQREGNGGESHLMAKIVAGGESGVAAASSWRRNNGENHG